MKESEDEKIKLREEYDTAFASLLRKTCGSLYIHGFDTAGRSVLYVKAWLNPCQGDTNQFTSLLGEFVQLEKSKRQSMLGPDLVIKEGGWMVAILDLKDGTSTNSARTHHFLPASKF